MDKRRLFVLLQPISFLPDVSYFSESVRTDSTVLFSVKFTFREGCISQSPIFKSQLFFEFQNCLGFESATGVYCGREKMQLLAKLQSDCVLNIDFFKAAYFSKDSETSGGSNFLYGIVLLRAEQEVDILCQSSATKWLHFSQTCPSMEL